MPVVVNPTPASVEDRLFPPGTSRSIYANLYREICETTYNDIPKYKVLDKLEGTYSSEEAEFLYKDATRDC
ncbi:hypothetical protein CH278_25715 [Rhodococcus sp. 05-2254-5]|nr:hypothetical protein CH278_25715 [Rhodococcus sp. 05-2254-5]OZE58302.1 hypothetical protein CH269_10875 [Rhodococcus sp. 05-2254-1]